MTTLTARRFPPVLLLPAALALLLWLATMIGIGISVSLPASYPSVDAGADGGAG